MNKPTINDQVYAENLAETNQKNRVIASEDILNDKGAILIKKGTPIDPKAALQIAKHRLKKQLDHSVAMENMLNQKVLNACFSKLLKIHPDLEKIDAAIRLNTFLESGIAYFCRHQLLRQKLSVMQQILPDYFIKTIAGTWFAAAIAVEMGESAESVSQVVTAALSRDLGMLHIEKKLANKSGKYTPHEWRTIQGHVVISKLLLDDVGNVAPMIKQAVLEHHERTDGDGYPRHKTGNNISKSGLILGMADALQAILTHKFAISGHQLGHIQGFLTLNMTTWSMDVYKAVIRLLKKGNCHPKLIVKTAQMPAYLNSLVEKNRKYAKICQALDELRPMLQQGSPRSEEIVLLNFSNRIHTMQTTTGVPSKVYGQWIEHVASHRLESAFEEMEMLGLMFDELKWQFGQMDRFITVLVGLDISSDEKKAQFAKIQTLLKSILQG